MIEHYNDLGQAIGFPVPDWQESLPPPRTAMIGQYCQVEPLDPHKHGADLYQANAEDREQRIWTYLPIGPFASEAAYLEWLNEASQSTDPLFHAIVDLNTGKATGVASFMRIAAPVGVIEVGNINYSPKLQKTPAATEAMFLMMQRVFDELAYRRYEWKCDALNAGSRRAALRLGFVFEGIFRQAIIYKGRNRDTAWYSILDKEWPLLKAAFQQWLGADNFTAAGEQKLRLSDLIIQHKGHSDGP